MIVTKDKVNMVRAILALLYNIYMSGENMFKGGGCVLYIFLLGFSLFFQWINETKLLSLNGKINGHTNSISSPRHLLGNKKVVE